MLEVAKLLIGKDIYCNSVDGSALCGILKEIVGNSILIEEKGKGTYVNLEYISQIREYPHKKNGKRANFV